MHAGEPIHLCVDAGLLDGGPLLLQALGVLRLQAGTEPLECARLLLCHFLAHTFEGPGPLSLLLLQHHLKSVRKGGPSIPLLGRGPG